MLIVWGNIDTNVRSETLLEFIRTNLEILNRGNTPIFVRYYFIIDLTICSIKIEQFIKGLRVSDDILSDHKSIIFKLGLVGQNIKSCNNAC